MTRDWNSDPIPQNRTIPYDQIMGMDRAFHEREQYIAQFKAALEKLGIVWNTEDNTWAETYKVERAISELKKTVDGSTIRDMRNLAASLNRAADELQPLIDQDKRMIPQEAR